MLVSDLIGATAREPDGKSCGIVIDVRAEPADSSELVVTGIVIAARRWRLFGFERRRQQGPALLWSIIRRLHRNTRFIRFGEFTPSGDRTVHLHNEFGGYPPVLADGEGSTLTTSPVGAGFGGTRPHSLRMSRTACSISRETCIWETPTSLAMSTCVRFLKYRR